MPPKKIIKKISEAPASPPQRLSSGSGITAGLEMWRVGPTIILHDRSPDGRFADDVERWNTVATHYSLSMYKSIFDAPP